MIMQGGKKTGGKDSRMSKGLVLKPGLIGGRGAAFFPCWSDAAAAAATAPGPETIENNGAAGGACWACKEASCARACASSRSAASRDGGPCWEGEEVAEERAEPRVEVSPVAPSWGCGS